MPGTSGSSSAQTAEGEDSDPSFLEAAFSAWQAMSSAMARPESQASLFSGIGTIPAVFSKIIESGLIGYSTLQQQWMSQIQKTEKYKGPYDFAHLDKEALHMWGDLYDNEFRKFLNIPQLGLTRFHQEKINQLNDRFTIFQTAMAEFLQLLLTPFEKSFVTMQEKLGNLAEKGEVPEDSKIVYNMWIKALEGHYMTLFKTPEYISAITKTLDSMEDYTSARQDVTDDILKLFSMPTKKDMDEVYKEQYMLKKRLRTLEKAIRNQ